MFVQPKTREEHLKEIKKKKRNNKNFNLEELLNRFEGKIQLDYKDIYGTESEKDDYK